MKEKNKIILVGGGGHCKVVIDAIKKNGHFEIHGIVDSDPELAEVNGVKVIGGDEALESIYQSGCRLAFISIGSVGDPSIRLKIWKQLKTIGFELAKVIHPAAVVAESVAIEAGTFIAAGVVLGPGTKIGENVIINTNSSVDHDCQIGAYVHIAPGVNISGGVTIGDYSHIGVGASIIECKNVGAKTIIGAGSVVISDIPASSKAFGMPCKVVGVNDAQK